MNLYSAGKVAFRSLRANKMRTILTMLGMIIGVAAVIIMVAIGAGANERIASQIASVGSNLLLVLPGSTTSGGLRSGFGSTPTLTMDDARAIGKELPAVALASPASRTSGPVVYGNQNWSTILQGVSPEYFEMRDWKTGDGRHFTTQEMDAAVKVCLLGSTVAENLFGPEDPVGKIVRIKRAPFTVVGVLESKGQSPNGQDQDDIVILPVTTLLKKLAGSAHSGSIGVVLVQAVDGEHVKEAEREATSLLRQRHRIAPGQDADFSVRNLSEMLALAESATRIMSLLLGGIASVSLVVGGIGIMNIMLVSVTERTREIGIRMAVGARERDILSQFLIEAVMLALTGGAVGIVLGSAGAVLISRLAGWSTLISPAAAFLAFGFSAAVGVFFGFYPARKASRMDPIEALRYE
ncbi:MAG: multidrug ABC transporter substrate-binding protein [Deltaproteobacteria bacterium CG2_30_66_27]|nr:MAG: multidrug ABC transporter substrate-binding protein [Deltaproteobacteria bacterium CG2_30_66_27]